MHCVSVVHLFITWLSRAWVVYQGYYCRDGDEGVGREGGICVIGFRGTMDATEDMDGLFAYYSKLSTSVETTDFGITSVLQTV